MFFFTVAGIVFSFLTMLSCEFIVAKSGRTFGIYQGQISNRTAECVSYSDIPDFEPNGSHQTAWICAAVAALCGFIALVLGVIQLLFCNVCCARCCISIPYTAAQICQLLTFLLFNTQVCTLGSLSCDLGLGGIYSIVAWACYFVASIIMCFTPSPDPLLCKKKNGKSRDCCECCGKGDEEDSADESPKNKEESEKKEGQLHQAVTE